MTALRRGNRRFWLELLELGDSEEERRRNWNVCCAWKISPSRESCIPDEHWNRFLERADVGVISDEKKDLINSLANSFGVHQMRLPRPSITFIPFMDFTGFEFANNMSFSGRVLFWADFSRAVFRGHTSFEDTMFLGGARFIDIEFPGHVNFNESLFGGDTEFAHVNFNSAVSFIKTDFRSTARFNKTKFRNITRFRRASFAKPPEFFATELHEATDFGKIDWSVAELSYNRQVRLGDPPTLIEYDAENATRAWDRLALVMSQQEKSLERHQFFRLKLRAQRQRDGNSLLTVANWMFDVSSDYGWSVQRALSWWAGHIAVGAVFLADGWPAVSNSLFVSFANSLAFLRLGSEGGYLYGPYETLKTTTSHAEWVINSIGAFQAVFGPILLFLVLLTLRNRFRLG